MKSADYFCSKLILRTDRLTEWQNEWETNGTEWSHKLRVGEGNKEEEEEEADNVNSLSAFGRRTLSVAGSTVWNALLDDLQDPTRRTENCYSSLKTFYSLNAKYIQF